MTDNHTLLSFIVQRHIKTRENAATDALGFILKRSEAARQGLSNVLQAKANGILPIASVETQFVIADGGIPDFVCFDAHGGVRALMEAKFGAPLTDRQPNAYWQTLPHDTPSALVFLVPTYRLYDLRDELTGRLVKVGFRSGKEDGAPNLISVPDINSHRHLILISWDEMLRHVEESAKANADPQALFELAQLRGVVVHVSNDTDLRLPDVLVECAKEDPSFEVVGYTAETILNLAKKVGVRETRRPAN